MKKKNTAHAAQRWFCRVNRRQNRSGVLRGGTFFLGNHLLKVVVIACWTSRPLCGSCQTSGDFFAFYLIFGLILRFFRISDSNFYPRAWRTKSRFCSLYVPCILLPRASQDNSRERNLVAVLGITSISQNSKGANKMDKLVSCKFNCPMHRSFSKVR